MIHVDGPQIWHLRKTQLDVSPGVLMGVINVTPDSFSDGGDNLDPHVAIRAGVAHWRAGAAIVDVGGESTRPGAEPVSEAEELARVMPVVEGLSGKGLVVSIDTTKPAVAAAALAAGAEIVNDVSACSSPGMVEVVADTGAGVVLMHSKGSPKTMQHDPRYHDVVSEVAAYLEARAAELVARGVAPETIAIDPGIGFGKTVAHNLQLMFGLNKIASLGPPVVLGTSRKTFLGVIAGIETPADRDGVTGITTALGYERGARVFRVHNVPVSRAALATTGAIVAPDQWEEWLQG